MTGETKELDAAFFGDPHRAYRSWGPGVHRVGFPGGRVGWVVTGYAEARDALGDPRLLKAGANSRWAGLGPAAGSHLLDSDPPDHTRLRKLVNQAFTPRAADALRPRIEELSAGLLERMHGDVDLLDAFAVPLPIAVIGELLGVTAGAFAEFRLLCAGLGNGTATPEQVRALREFLRNLVAGKRAAPGDDLLSRLVRARDDEERLSERELVTTAFLLLFAGHETTVHLIGNGTYALLRNPDQLAALREDPALVPDAVEELLRYDGPVGFATLRYAAEPMRLGTAELDAGDFVHVAVGAANRDPAKFRDPDRLDLARRPAGHVAFGHGIHFCVGAPLARLEAEVAFSQLLHRFPRLRLADEAATPAWREGIRIRGLVRLPVRLD